MNHFYQICLIIYERNFRAFIHSHCVLIIFFFLISEINATDKIDQGYSNAEQKHLTTLVAFDLKTSYAIMIEIE